MISCCSTTDVYNQLDARGNGQSIVHVLQARGKLIGNLPLEVTFGRYFEATG